MMNLSKAMTKLQGDVHHETLFCIFALSYEYNCINLQYNGLSLDY